MQYKLHVTAIPSANYFSNLATNDLLSGIRMNGILFSSADTQKEFSLIPKNTTVPLWLDAKGRQLRIVEAIYHKDHLELVLNHKITGLILPHPILFKAGEDWATVEKITDDGKRLHMRADGYPKYRVNPGDSIHFRNEKVAIVGPLFAENEKDKILNAVNLGFNKFYLSYVESQKDVDEFVELVGKDSLIILKIESKKGLQYVEKDFQRFNRSWRYYNSNIRLACARGDLYVEVNKPHHIVEAQKLIISKDSKALVGSRMLLSLFNNEVPACSDLCELELLKSLGYTSFLLCDDLCKKGSSLERAITTFHSVMHTK